MKFGEKLSQSNLSRLSHKACRLLPSPVLLRKFTIVQRGTGNGDKGNSDSGNEIGTVARPLYPNSASQITLASV